MSGRKNADTFFHQMPNLFVVQRIQQFTTSNSGICTSTQQKAANANICRHPYSGRTHTVVPLGVHVPYCPFEPDDTTLHLLTSSFSVLPTETSFADPLTHSKEQEGRGNFSKHRPRFLLSWPFTSLTLSRVASPRPSSPPLTRLTASLASATFSNSAGWEMTITLLIHCPLYFWYP